MNFKKLLLIITISIILVFSLMMLTSYAYYTFSGGSTSFNKTTYNQTININYTTNKFINVTNAIPIKDSEASSKAANNSFSVSITQPNTTAEVLLDINLSNISIDDALKNEYFRYQFLYNNSVIKEGTALDIVGSNLNLTNTLSITSAQTNNFVFRIWISDSDVSQNSMLNKTFTGSIEVNAVKIRNY